MKGNIFSGAIIANDISAQVAGNDFRGIATGALPGPLAKLLDSFGKAADAFDARGRELGKFSPDISVARSNSFVRQFQADQYEAGVAGGSYASLIENLTDLQATLQEDLAPLKNEIAKALAELVGGLTQILEDTHVVPTMVDLLIQLKITNQQVGEALLDAVNGNFDKAADDLAGIGAKIDENRRERAADEERKKHGFDHIWQLPQMQLPPRQGKNPRADDRFGFGIMGGA